MNAIKSILVAGILVAIVTLVAMPNEATRSIAGPVDSSLPQVAANLISDDVPVAQVIDDRLDPPDAYSGLGVAITDANDYEQLTGYASAADKLNAKEPTKAEKRAIARAKMSGPVAALASIGGQQPASIIVSYDEHPELFEDGRIEKLGGEIIRRYEILDLLAIRIPARSLEELAVGPDVTRLSLDDEVQVSSTSAKLTANTPYSPSSNAYYHGLYEGIALVDTGVALHGDLAVNIQQYDFVGGNFPEPDDDDYEEGEYDTDDRVDGYGHGTHVAGILTGYGKYSNREFYGSARRAKLVSLRVLGDDGSGSVSDVLAALEWLLKYGGVFDISVVNLSLGAPISESNTTDPLVRAVERLWDSGFIVVVAAGNNGRDGNFTITSPGNSRKVITVGSLTDNDTGDTFADDYVSTYSSHGPSRGDFVMKPDLVAPGNRIISTIPQNSMLKDLLPGRVVSCTVASSCAYNYLSLSGTSMAAPMVSATAALMLQKSPGLSPSTVKARLMRSARKLDESPIVAGAGLLDIDAALDDTGELKGQALSPLMSYDEATGSTLVQDTAQLWGDSAWSLGFLWTDGGVSAKGFLWTDGTIGANGFLWTDGTAFAKGFLWTDTGGGIQTNGFLWTDGKGVSSEGFLWTDGSGVSSEGYLWTDGGGIRSLALYDLAGPSPVINDDEPTSD